MNQDQVLDKILTKLDGVDKKVDSVVVRMDKTDKQMDLIVVRMDKTDKQMDLIVVRMDKTNEQIDLIATKVVQIEERLDTFVTKDEMNEKFDLVLNNIDRFVKLHETLDLELVSLRHKYTRLEERLDVVERKLQLA